MMRVGFLMKAIRSFPLIGPWDYSRFDFYGCSFAFTLYIYISGHVMYPFWLKFSRAAFAIRLIC
jgi:hypothetical protein